MKIKRIAGTAVNWCNSVIAQMDNGGYAMVPTVDDDGDVVEWNPVEGDQGSYLGTYIQLTKWFPVNVNGYVDEWLFKIAMVNLKKLFTNDPINGDTLKMIKKSRTSDAEKDEQEAESYCRKEYDASGQLFMAELEEIFSNGPIDPTKFVPKSWELDVEEALKEQKAGSI